MGIIKWLAEEVVSDVVEDAELAVLSTAAEAVGPAVEAGKKVVKAAAKTTKVAAKASFAVAKAGVKVGKEAIGATVKASKAASSAVTKTVAEVQNKRNLSALKKEGKNQGVCLLVNQKPGTTEGFFSVTDLDGEERYNSYLERSDSEQVFTLHLYAKNHGEIASVVSNSPQKKSLFKKDNNDAGFAVSYYGEYLGNIFPGREGKQTVYRTDFNDWLFTGELSKGNYIVFDKTSGYTLATITRKYKNATTFSVTWETNDEPELFLLFSILIEIIK